MPESYAQRKNAVQRSLGQVKRSLNQANGQLEKVRREAMRLSERKTIITPDDLVKLGGLWADTLKVYNTASNSLTQLLTVARSYL